MVNQFVKIGVMIASMVLSRMVNTQNPNTLMMVRICYVISILLQAAVHYFIRELVRRRKDETKIYIVKKMLGQEMVEETTYFEKEEMMCTNGLTGSLSGIVMTLGLMSMKMGLHYGMVMQMIQLPFNLYTNPLFQKYVLNKEVDHPWGEQTEVPISKMNREGREDAIKEEITKCWDDGEVANYDRLLQLCQLTGPNVANDKGWTPLMVILGNPLGDMSVLSKLINMGIDITLTDKEGWNCLHWAAYHNNVGGVEAMIECRGFAYIMKLLVMKNKDGLTPEQLAKKEGQNEFANWVHSTIIDEIEVMHDLGTEIDNEVEKKLLCDEKKEN